MAKVHPQVVANSTSTKQEEFTVWMKSLILGSNGCAVFDSAGEIVYRVDNYCHKSSNQVHVLDATGKVLFTIVKKKFSVLGLWEGYRSRGGGSGVKNKENPGFRVRKLVGIRMILGLLTGYWSYKVVVRLSEDQTCEYVMETHVSRPCCKIVDNSGGLVAEQLRRSDTVTNPERFPLSATSTFMAAENPNPKISLYYQTRAAHHGVVTSDWLAQAQAAAGGRPDDAVSENYLSSGEEDGKGFSVVDEFNNWRKQPELAEAVAAIRALASVIRSSQATTMMELEIELKKAVDSLKSWDTTSISLTAGCDLFIRYVTRTSALEYEDFSSAKSRLIERAEKFGEISYKARIIIAMLGQDFILDGCTILVHGFSRVVLEVLRTAAQNKKQFRVFCTEGRPDRTGLRLSNELAKLDVPVKLLIDSAVAYSMDEVDMVFVGADRVVESGGIINMMGTYQIALVAKSMNKPVYVAAESYKFARLYPLDQKDMEPALRPIDFGVPIPSKVEVETSARDYTPPQYLTLLFTDLGVLTPSVVSDELIQLYL
ncbi:Translation initiation factor eIF-2B subunit alpha [Sesamum alatum]|uniref:Translation initiation factor eIF2B subunit alpha n=1 Tax=Sesamum alatum TaxID=300844 RepID=A0AAE1XKN6_9LAMI|nr:Translation initiation factor eIF-2B subunit alpha [Sesamum alatum]